MPPREGQPEKGINRSGANAHDGALIGRPGLHDRDFMKAHGPKLALFAFPMFVQGREAKGHSAEISTLGQCENIAAVRCVRQIEIEMEARSVFRQAERAAL